MMQTTAHGSSRRSQMTPHSANRQVFSLAGLPQGAEQPEERAGRWNQWGQPQLWKHTKHQWQGEVIQQHMLNVGVCTGQVSVQITRSGKEMKVFSNYPGTLTLSFILVAQNKE